MKEPDIHKMLAEFADQRCLVVGDVMVDRYLTGTVTRQSPEAPVPILDLQTSDARLGGAANVALNLVDLCQNVSICAIVGKEEAGNEFRLLLANSGIDDSGLLALGDRTTTVKTRLMNSTGHLMRVDQEDTSAIDGNTIKILREKLQSIIQSEEIDVVILQDYNKGLLQPELIEFILQQCQKANIPVAVDPKFDHILSYREVDLFKPNLAELQAILGRKVPPTLEALDHAAEQLHGKLGYRRLLVTLSAAGIYYREDGKSAIIPAFPREIRDVCGAGDTVIAVAALALASKQSISEIAWISNLAGGIVCEFAGVQAISTQLLTGSA